MDALIRGMVTGLSIAVPIGPNGALCIRRSLTGGRAAGFATGLGAATAHAFSVAVAVAGLGFSQWLSGRADVVRPVAGLVLVALGVKAWRSGITVADGPAATVRHAYTSTLALALANPLTVASLTAVLAALGAPPDELGPALLVVTGVFAGSAAWWFALSSTVVALRSRLGSRHLHWVSRTSAAGMGGFGILALVKSI